MNKQKEKIMLRVGGNYWENKLNIILNELEINLSKIKNEK